MAVTLNDLGRNGSRLQAQAAADFFFQFRFEMGEIADRAGKFAHAHLFRCALQTAKVARDFRMPVCQLESKGDGLGVDPMRASDHGSMLELVGAAMQDIAKLLKVPEDYLRGGLDLQRLGRVHYIVRGQAVMEPASMGADLFCDGCSEGDHIVFYLGFDFLNAL